MEEAVRIVVLDFYMASPLPGLDITYSDFRAASVNQVPILRCFGSTKSGEKICVHIHGVFPYLYIPYDGVGSAEGLMYQIAANIDKAVNTSLNQGTSSSQHVYKISLVSGIPMYGYHPKKHQFLKIYLYNPMLVSTVTNLLLNQSILDRIFQPHEAHINFTLQFMIDYNLHGMSNMHISNFKYRVNPDIPNTNIDKELFLPANIEKITVCELEVDVNAENILNRQEIINGNLAANPGIAALWADEQQRRRNKNEDSQLGQFLELKNMKFTPTKTHLIFQQALMERLAVLSTDQEVQKDNLNISVYPAETPNNANIQNASIIDIHTPSSLELSLDDTLNFSNSQNLDSTLTPTQSNLNMTLDEDANNFLRVLEELADEKGNENIKEEDSILSQNLKEDEQNDDSTEDFLDLTMPLAAVTTPKKVDTKVVSDKSDDEDENYFNTTLIPQIDGQTEISNSSDKELVVRMTRSKYRRDIETLAKNSNSSKRLRDKEKDESSSKKSRCGVSMPLLDKNMLTSESCTEAPLNKLNMNLIVKLHRIKQLEQNEPKLMSKLIHILPNRTKKTQQEKIEEHLRLIRFRIKRMNVKSKIKRIGNIFRRTEVAIGTWFKKKLRPKFNIIPARKWFLDTKNVKMSPIPSYFKSTSKPQWDRTYNRPYKSGTVAHRRRSVPNMYINCDGAIDSSSEDEDSIKIESKRNAKRRGAFQYAPLQISVTKSPRASGNYLDAGLAENIPGITGDRKDFHDNSSEVDQKKMLSKSCVSFKRKLNFENEVPLNNTKIEEFLSCAYSPSSITKISVSKVNNDTKDSEKPSVPQDNIADTDCDQNSYNSQSWDNNKSQQLESTCSDSDLFSEEEDVNKSFFRNYHLTAAEKYDKETHFRAKEGCSTIFTPSSIVNYDTVSNQTSQVLSHNSSSIDNISQETQQLEKNKNNFEITKENQRSVPTSENSSSDLTPYQKVKRLSDYKSRIETTSLSNLKILKPSTSAPTKLQVETSLNELKIEEVHFQEPFYSNVEDYTGVVEIGHTILKIPSKATCHLSEFESNFNGLSKYRKHFTENVANLIWNSNNLKNLKLSHCNVRDIIIHPVKKSPSVKMVLQWLENNSKQKALPVTPDVKNQKPKIYIPMSPGNDQDDLELSLTMTPCTPASSQATSTQSNEPATPKSSLNFQSSSPILDHRKKKCKKKNLNEVHPPSLKESLLLSREPNQSCQITGVSQQNSFGFNKSVQNLQAARVVLEYQNLTTIVMELHIRTRGDFKPDPEYDPICAIFYSILNDVPETHTKKSKARGVIALNTLPITVGKPDEHFLDGICINCDITYAESEEALINSFLSIIKFWDPDIFAGYEIQMLSWGYLIDRAFVLSINIIPLLGRSPINKYGRAKQRTTNYEIENVITGRIILDVWRIMRHEIALQSYTFESIVYHILHKRVPMFAFKDLTFWWDHRTSLFRHRVVTYYLLRVETVLELFHKLDFLNRTSELARLFGILFYEVLSRGSQFRVESMMLRLAKPLNYIPVSPSQAQRAKMKAPEYIALVMEPESKLYNDPVIVLDFQSLYPSIIIAYNYCFTTCVGRVSCLGTNSPYDFGATQLKVRRKVVEKLSKKKLLNFSPCAVAFVKQKVRQGILPRMLTEILDTRLMVKNSMKENKGNDNLQKVLHNRQLGLKLIANVTYGYTAANFSGRMCCVEVGDSVVSKARETLQRAIALVENTTKWGARVVYGDTDSLFVMVPGKNKETAFEIGKQIADAITADNPDPVKLKLEKVYQPCILQTKKRYVGYMYESPDQKEPVYDAKGIETVRRDGCPAVAKMLQKCLTLLFETKDVSLIKKYVLRQFNKIQAGRASIQDLTFAKEYRGASGYKPGACVPALELARKWKAIDKRSEPRSGERVPYIIVNGPPGLPLIRLVRSPKELLNDSSLRPNSLYYITKVIIPPINRCLNLIGADLHTWFNQMPRRNTQYLPNSSPIVKSTISQYFISKICASCSQPTQNGLCDRCCKNVNVTAFTLTEKLKKWEENHHNAKLICYSCTGHLNEITCISLDCPVLYRRTQTYNDLQQSTYVRELLSSTDIFSENNIFDD